MPDISKCNNENCLVKELCYRYTSIPNEFSQSYNDYSPKNNTEVDFDCESFISNKHYEDKF